MVDGRYHHGEARHGAREIKGGFIENLGREESVSKLKMKSVEVSPYKRTPRPVVGAARPVGLCAGEASATVSDRRTPVGSVQRGLAACWSVRAAQVTTVSGVGSGKREESTSARIGWKNVATDHRRMEEPRPRQAERATMPMGNESPK